MNPVVNSETAHLSKVFVACDQGDTAAAWDYILRQHGILVILETALDNAVDHWSAEITDIVVVDLAQSESLELCRKFRQLSVAPILLFLPVHHETQIIEAYAAGVDEVIVKPVSPAVFLAKVVAWLRRSWTVRVDGLNLVQAGTHGLDPARRALLGPNGQEVKLTNLELRLLLLLMSGPGHNFGAEEIIRTIWGEHGSGDEVSLKNVVYRLRRKIEADPSHPLLLQTGPGGYFFQG